MPQINQLSAVDQLQAGDNFPLYNQSNGGVPARLH